MSGVNRILNNLGLSPVWLSSFEWVMAVIDVAIVAYALYTITKFIKDTRAWSLFKGLLLIIALYLLSDVLKLYTVQWIIQNTLNVGIIAVIIIFQPELRKALEELGKGKIVSAFSVKGAEGGSVGGLTEKSVGEIVFACMLMAKVRTGALIVIQRQVGLMDLETKGVAIDAAISKQLLINIFEDKTPLHDGAVIIKGDRIAAASCVMPLTETNLGQNLGTRHRAAVGASEISDALVIVVSEETGVISTAQNGKLRRNASDGDLYELLSGERNKEPKHKRKARDKSK